MSQQVVEKEPAVELSIPKPQPASAGDKPLRSGLQKRGAWLFGPIGMTLLVMVIFVGLMGCSGLFSSPA